MKEAWCIVYSKVKHLVTHYSLRYSLGGNKIHIYYMYNLYFYLLCSDLLPLINYKFQGYPVSTKLTSLIICALLIRMIIKVLVADQSYIYLMVETLHSGSFIYVIFLVKTFMLLFEVCILFVIAVWDNLVTHFS